MFGLNTYTDTGTLQLSADVLTYVLHSKGTGTSITRLSGNTNPSSALVYYPDTLVKPLIAISCNSGMGLVGPGSPSGSNKSQEYACEGAVGTAYSYWIFTKADGVNPSSSGVGMKVWNGSGALAYDTGYAAMRIVDTIAGGSSSATGTLAFVQGAYANTRAAGLVTTSSGRIPSGSDRVGTTYKETQSGRILGGRINSSTGAASLASISFDDVSVYLGTSQTPPPNFAMTTSLLIVDVANL